MQPGLLGCIGKLAEAEEIQALPRLISKIGNPFATRCLREIRVQQVDQPIRDILID